MMKAVILAAGKGTRIHSLSGGEPKSMLPLGDTTLLGQSLRHFHNQGIRDLVIVTGYRREVITEYVRREWPGRVEFVFNPHYDSTNVLYSFWLALPYLGKEDFVFLHADTVFAPEVLTRVLSARAGADMVFAVDNHPCEEEEMKVQVQNDRIVLVTKQMPSDSADGEFLGLARIAGNQTENLRRNAESLFEEGVFNAFFEMAVQRMIDREGLVVEVADVSGLPWREVDFPEDYAAAREFFN